MCLNLDKHQYINLSGGEGVYTAWYLDDMVCVWGLFSLIWGKVLYWVSCYRVCAEEIKKKKVRCVLWLRMYVCVKLACVMMMTPQCLHYDVIVTCCVGVLLYV